MASRRLILRNARTIPNYDFLVKELNYSWVKDYLRMRVIPPERDALREEIAKYRQMRQPVEDVLKELKASYEKNVIARKNWLTNFIRGQWEVDDPLRRLSSSVITDVSGTRMEKRQIFFTWDEIKAAAKAVKFDGQEMNQKKRLGKIAELESKITALNSEYSGLNLPGKGQKTRIRQNFVDNWYNLQRTCNAGCNILGLDIEQASRAERKAWKLLGIDSGVNKYFCRLKPAKG